MVVNILIANLTIILWKCSKNSFYVLKTIGHTQAMIFLVMESVIDRHWPLPVILSNYCMDLGYLFQSRKYIFTTRNRASNVSDFLLKSPFLSIWIRFSSHVWYYIDLGEKKKDAFHLTWFSWIMMALTVFFF